MGGLLALDGLSLFLATCLLALVCAAGVVVHSSVTRQRAEALAQQAKALADSEPGARALVGAEGQVLFVNRAGRALWGQAPPVEALAARLLEDEDSSALLDRLTQAALVGGTAQGDLPLRMEEGETVDWWAVSVRPGHQPGAVIWSAEDVTARRVIDDVLLRERDDLAEFLTLAPIGLYSADSAGDLVFANHRLAEWLGGSPETLLGRNLQDLLIDGESAPDMEGSWQGRLTFRDRQGQPLPTLVVQSTYDDAGETRTRSAVLALYDSLGGDEDPAGDAPSPPDRRFRWLFDHAPIGLCLLDPDGVVSDCNPAFLAMAGRERAAVVDHPLSALLHPEDQRDLDVLIQKSILAGDHPRAAREVRFAGREDHSATLTLSPIGRGASADGLVAHMIDATAQRSLEAQFAQAQKMQAMGQLAGGVAHDFNNLLTAMIGYCDLLLQRHGAGDPSFADIMQIHQNANRAANLVRQLLAFSRKQPLTPRPVSVTDALAELNHLLRRLLGESVTLDLRHGRDVGTVRVDPGQFDQVVVNLAVNARDAMPGGGRLTIRTQRQTLTAPRALGAEQMPPGSYAVIEVSDTGSGIARENLVRIFEPFFTTKGGGKLAGTGLGLSTVYGILRQTGGYITVDSVVGQGTTFTIYLPSLAEEAEAPVLPPPKQAPTPPPALPPDLGGSETILLVEDEDPVRIFATRALRNKGYTVIEARTGEQAQELLPTIPHLDILITDMVMPGLDGATLARLVREERPSLPVILMSGYSEEAARGELTANDAVHFLPKPFSLSQLAAKVKEVLALPPAP